MSYGKPKSKVPLADVYYYFDAVARDRLDAAGLSRKSGEVLALRERLLRLPDGEFESVIKTLRALVEERPTIDLTPRQAGGAGGEAAQSLFDQLRPGGKSGGTSAKVTAT